MSKLRLWRDLLLRLLSEPPTRRLLYAVASILVVGGTATVAVDDDGPSTAPPPQLVIHAPGLSTAVDTNNQTDVAEQRLSAAGNDPAIHEDARDETPPGVSPDAAQRIIDSPTQGIGERRPVGGAQIASCRSRFVRNFSDRSPDAVVKIFVLHYTVSSPGSLDAIWNLFNTPAFGASSHLLLEPTGRCEKIVPWSKKAWTQGAFNSVSESVEIMAMGTESRQWWLSQPIIRDGILASIVVDRLRANGLPLRHVDPFGCGVQQAGWTDHDALECGNSHHDVMPNFPYGKLNRQVRRTVLASSGRRCWKVHVYRADRRLGHVLTPERTVRYRRRLARLQIDQVRCDHGRPMSLV